MSRTYKDRPYKFTQETWDMDRIKVPYTRVGSNWEGDLVEHEWYSYMYTKTTKPKKRKEVDTEDHWMTTPSWWNHMVHTKRRRRAAKIWEVNVLKAVDLEDVDKPLEGNKPHWYFW